MVIGEITYSYFEREPTEMANKSTGIGNAGEEEDGILISKRSEVDIIWVFVGEDGT